MNRARRHDRIVCVPPAGRSQRDEAQWAKVAPAPRFTMSRLLHSWFTHASSDGVVLSGGGDGGWLGGGWLGGGWWLGGGGRNFVDRRRLVAVAYNRGRDVGSGPAGGDLALRGIFPGRMGGA